MRAVVHSLLTIVALFVLLAITPDLLWLLGAEGPWLSWLPTEHLVAGFREGFWRHMALGMVNGIVLMITAWAAVIVWQKWDGHANDPRH